jgi:hypothetical protein
METKSEMSLSTSATARIRCRKLSPFPSRAPKAVVAATAVAVFRKPQSPSAETMAPTTHSPIASPRVYWTAVTSPTQFRMCMLCQEIGHRRDFMETIERGRYYCIRCYGGYSEEDESPPPPTKAKAKEKGKAKAKAKAKANAKATAKAKAKAKTKVASRARAQLFRTQLRARAKANAKAKAKAKTN